MVIVLSTLEKLKTKFYRVPVPNDITYDEMIRLARSYGCAIKAGGKHPIKIIDIDSGTVIPIPVHGKFVQEVYICQLKEMFREIESRQCVNLEGL